MGLLFSRFEPVAFDHEKTEERDHHDSSKSPSRHLARDFSSVLRLGDPFLEKAEQGISHPLFLARFPQHQGECLPPQDRIRVGEKVDGGIREAVKETSTSASPHTDADGVQGARLGAQLKLSQKVFPGGEMGVNGRPSDPGLARDVFDADTGQSRLGDFCHGHLEDAISGSQALARAHGEGFGSGVGGCLDAVWGCARVHIGRSRLRLAPLGVYGLISHFTVVYNAPDTNRMLGQGRGAREMGRLQGRVAIVTGAGQGVGHGVARALASEGAKVVCANRNAEKGEAAVAGIRDDFGSDGAEALYRQTDVSQRESVFALVEETVSVFGGVDILVNNATPTGGTARFEAMTDAAMNDYMSVNYYASFWAMQAAFPHMKAKGFGRIITMASLNGINAHRYTVMYNGSKEAARSLTRTAAVEWGRYGITCNVLCPFAATPSWQGFEKFDPEGARAIVEGNPIRYAGDSEKDIGPVVVFLASEESRFVTGNTIHADGGGHINGVAWKMELPE